jgi:hypothetical protein
VQQYIITIEGTAFTDFDEIELPRLPDDGDPLETKYGTCVVIGTEVLPEDRRYDGKIVCRLP